MLCIPVPGAQQFTFPKQSPKQQLILHDRIVLIAQMRIEGLARLPAAGQEIPSRSAALSKIAVTDAFQFGDPSLTVTV